MIYASKLFVHSLKRELSAKACAKSLVTENYKSVLFRSTEHGGSLATHCWRIDCVRSYWGFCSFPTIFWLASEPEQRNSFSLHHVHNSPPACIALLCGFRETERQTCILRPSDTNATPSFAYFIFSVSPPHSVFPADFRLLKGLTVFWTVASDFKEESSTLIVVVPTVSLTLQFGKRGIHSQFPQDLI